MKDVLKNIRRVLDKNEKKRFFILSLLDIIVSILDILFLAGLLWIVRFYIQPDYENKLAFLPDWLVNRNSVSFIAVFVILFSIKNMLAFILSRAHFRFISRVAVRISANNLANYQQAAFSEFVNTDSSVHIRNICFRPFEFTQYILSGIQQMVTQLSLILLAIIAILMFNAKLFLLLLLILLPPAVIVFWYMKKRLTVIKKNIQASNQVSFKYVMDALKGWVEGNMYGRNDFFRKRFVDARKEFSTYLFDSLALQNLPSRVIEIFAVLGLFILIVIAGWMDNNDSNLLITIGAFMAAAYKIIPGMVKVINISGQMKAYEFSVSDLENAGKSETFHPGKSQVDEFTSVEFRNISFRYTEQPVLNGFSMLIKKGDFIGITGESGKGKTTILNLLLGFLPSDEGNILINDVIVNSHDIKNYWPQTAYVRQQGFFIHDSVLKNITLEETGYDKDNLQQALSVSGLDKLVEKFPEGIEKVITENGKNISGGQQQRVAIARALYKNASLILLDEPFNELDEEASLAMLKHFRKLAESGKTVIMITHDKMSLSFCNKIISLDEQ